MRILDRLEETLIATLIAAATVVIFVAVAHRYTTDFVVNHRSWPGAVPAYVFLSKIHLSWAQELCIYMFVWMAKFGAAS
ncbi:MAG TPA: C4-dicarboxylate ABC transporter permease, partial [Afipia sp.]|nr:C4-dicarboxylate ABC transporter permease [Afipia sp.]